MASQARRPVEPQNRFLRPLVPILIVLVAGIVFLFIGNVISASQSADSTPLDAGRMIPYLVVGAVVVYGLALLAGDRDLWRISTREVVYMAIGAALYGVLSWATNIIQLPSVSLVSLRPAIVIPIFFGVVFGPVVGFFTGFVGNVLGDALTGWGVSPTWDIGNGLIGLIAGLAVVFPRTRRSLNITAISVIVILAIISALLLLYPETENVLFGEGTVGAYWWIPLLAAALVAVAWVLLRDREELALTQMWGALAIIGGIGFAAIADIWWNGYSLLTALLGEFVPATSSNLINALILLPILLAAWRSAQAQTGR